MRDTATSSCAAPVGPWRRPRRARCPWAPFPDAPSEGGTLVLGAGDLLVVYSDGLPDSLGDHAPSSEQLSALAVSAPTAAAVVERLIALAPTQTTLPDGLTVIALRCTG